MREDSVNAVLSDNSGAGAGPRQGTAIAIYRYFHQQLDSPRAVGLPTKSTSRKVSSQYTSLNADRRPPASDGSILRG